LLKNADKPGSAGILPATGAQRWKWKRYTDDTEKTDFRGYEKIRVYLFESVNNRRAALEMEKYTDDTEKTDFRGTALPIKSDNRSTLWAINT
jgi:hypothetical protein